MKLINLNDYVEAAKQSLPLAVRDWVYGGSEDELTLKENCEAFRRLQIRQRVLVDVSKVNLTATVLGLKLPSPILPCPIGIQKILHPDGELAVARAAQKLKTVMSVSTASSYSLEEIAKNTKGPKWFQVYVFKDIGITHDLMNRAAQAGYSALIVTVDAPAFGRRERDFRNGFKVPGHIQLENLLGGLTKEQLTTAPFDSYFDRSFSWKQLATLMKKTNLKIIVKGIQTVEDAKIARDHGVSAIIVSNHGGRQLDASVATIDSLRSIGEKYADEMDLILDSGVRRGTDVIKAIALGAKAVMIGRPYLSGLALAGEEGVLKVFELLNEELSFNMMLAGCPNLSSITRSLIKG